MKNSVNFYFKHKQLFYTTAGKVKKKKLKLKKKKKIWRQIGMQKQHEYVLFVFLFPKGEPLFLSLPVAFSPHWYEKTTSAIGAAIVAAVAATCEFF